MQIELNRRLTYNQNATKAGIFKEFAVFTILVVIGTLPELPNAIVVLAFVSAGVFVLAYEMGEMTLKCGQYLGYRRSGSFYIDSACDQW